jgi:hypothetical protein
MSLSPQSIQETLHTLTGVMTDTRKLAEIAGGLKGQLESLMKQESARLNPNPLAARAQAMSYEVNLVPATRDCTHGTTGVRANQIVLLHGRLWMYHEGCTWALELTDHASYLTGVRVDLPPLGSYGRPQGPVGGAKVKTVLPIKYSTTDAEGKTVWHRTEVDPQPMAWVVGTPRVSIYTDGTHKFVLGEPVINWKGRTVWHAELHGEESKDVKVQFLTVGTSGRTMSKRMGIVKKADIESHDDELWLRHEGLLYSVYKASAGSEAMYIATWRTKPWEPRSGSGSPPITPPRALFRTVKTDGTVVHEEVGELGVVMCDDDEANTQRTEHKGLTYVVSQDMMGPDGMAIATRKVSGTIRVLFQTVDREGQTVREHIGDVNVEDVDRPAGPGGTDRVTEQGLLYELTGMSQGVWIGTRRI